MTRRRFVFWISLGIFSVGERLRVSAFDRLATIAMRTAAAGSSPPISETPTHWRAAENATWKWFEREELRHDKWQVTGLTTPVHKTTGVRYTGRQGYLDESLVPPEIRAGQREAITADTTPAGDEVAAPGVADPTRRARHGRPPSRWLRSLNADELRIWLKTIDVPEAGVSGMTYWEHLIRDHSFESAKIEGLLEDELALLHAAAHYGY